MWPPHSVPVCCQSQSLHKTVVLWQVLCPVWFRKEIVLIHMCSHSILNCRVYLGNIPDSFSTPSLSLLSVIQAISISQRFGAAVLPWSWNWHPRWGLGPAHSGLSANTDQGRGDLSILLSLPACAQKGGRQQYEWNEYLFTEPRDWCLQRRMEN